MRLFAIQFDYFHEVPRSSATRYHSLSHMVNAARIQPRTSPLRCTRLRGWLERGLCDRSTPSAQFWLSRSEGQGCARGFRREEVYLPCGTIAILSQTPSSFLVQISEAHAGSDVFGLQTTATKTDDGKHWIINGHKKWITNGT